MAQRRTDLAAQRPRQRRYAGPMGDETGGAPIRASDAEREVAVRRMRDAAAEGRLTFEELADRVEAAAGAVTRQDLQRLTADLPAEPAARPSPEVAPAPTRASTVLGDVRRAGPWTIPSAKVSTAGSGA